MYFTGIYSPQDAKNENLIQLTIWLYKEDLGWVMRERDRIGSNKVRKAMIVQRNSSYALFVDDVTGRYHLDSAEADKENGFERYK